MKTGWMMGIFALGLAGISAAAAPKAAAQSGAVRVIASNGVKGVLDEVRAQCEHVIGRPLDIEFGTTATLKPQIEKGEVFDVAILTSEATDALIKEGKLSAASRANVSRVGIGVGIRKGAAKPDIRTADALKATLLKAKSITYAKEGASRPTIDRMIERLGIGDALKSKTMMLDGADQTSAAVADGKTELLLTLISEIVSAPGVEYVGPLPREFQSYVGFAAAMNSKSQNQKASAGLIQYLTGGQLASAFKAKGMETN